MNRREFSLQLAGLAGATALAGIGMLPRAVLAQGGPPVEGQDYLKLKTPIPVQSAGGKIEVLEFFWYACPHCFHFEPVLEPWVHRQPADVRFRRIPVGFSGARQEFHQRIYFTLEAMNLVDALHAKVFERFHIEHKPLDHEADLVQFAKDNGVDATKFMAIFNGFSMPAKITQANDLVEAYGIDGVPEIGIHGRFVTGPSMAGDETKALMVTDYLINQVRKGS